MLQKDQLTVNSDLAVLNQIQVWFKGFLMNQTKVTWIDEPLFDRLNLALAEGFTNAVRHAHKELPPETSIDIALSLSNERLEIQIWDYGDPFDPDVLKEPELGILQEGGYGWFLMRRLADQVAYERKQDGRNCLIIVKESRT